MSQSICSRITRGAVVLLTALLVAAPSLAAQSGTVTGRVADERSGNPLSAAQIFIAELELGALSQQNGTFTIQNVPAGTYTVTVQRLGYRQASQTVTVAAGESVFVEFVIGETALQLDELIVTGTPGGTQRRAIGNTVQRMSVADITQAVAINDFQDLLEGRTPGLRFSVLSGNVGTGSQITLRGVGSFNTGRNQPLIYVDGIRVNNNTFAGPTLGDTAGGVNVLNDFNPDEIESIEIIKGPAAASLYGSEASSGVIQIITKRGNEGAPQFTFSTTQGVNYISDPAGRLGTMWTCPTAFSPHVASPNQCTTQDQLVTYNMYDEATRYIREGYFDWDSPNLFSYGPSRSYNLDIAGGTSAIRYFASAGYDDQTGIVSYNRDKSMRFRGNLNIMLMENLTLDISSGYISGDTRFDQATTGDGAIWQDLFWSNGFYLDRITPFGTPGSNPRLGGFQEHLPTDVRDLTFATRDYDRFTGSATLNHNFSNIDLRGLGTGSLTQRLITGVDKGWDVNVNLFPLEPGVVPEHLREFTDSWQSVYTETDAGEMTYQRPITTAYTIDYGVTAGIVVNPTWTLDTSFGFQYYSNSSDVFTNSGQGFASPLSRTINQIAQSRLSTSYSYIENKSQGYYVQQQVGWNDRLFLTGALRWDDNSTFGSDTPAQRYPKVSGTWVISEESFWNFDAVNSLRLRGAWGQAGRQPGALAGFNVYTAIPGPGGAPAIRPQSPGNSAIEPEVSTEIEVGFDYALLDDRFSGEFTYYTRKNEGALLSLAIPSSFGVPGSVDSNLGRIDNWGWEATLNTRVYQNDAFSFDLDLGADYSDNEIKSLGDYPGTASIAIGLPWPNHVQYDWVVDAEFIDADDPRSTFIPGLGNLANAFGERIYATCDPGVSLAPEGAENPGQYGRVPGGDPVFCGDVTRGLNLHAGRAFHPYSFSVAPRLTMMNGRLQVFALAQGQYGGYNHDNAHAWGHFYNNSLVSRLEDDPYWVTSDRMNSTRATIDKSRYKADFWKLREVGALFQLPESLVQRTGASRAALSFSARNIWTIWQKQDEVFGMPVVDPEYGNSSNLGGESNFWSSPGLSSVTATFRVTF